MSVFELYLVAVLPVLSLTLILLGVAIVVVFGVVAMATYDEYNQPLRFRLKQYIMSGVIMMFLGVIIPNEKGMLIIVGGSYLTSLEGAEKIPVNSVEAINKLLTDYINESKEPEGE